MNITQQTYLELTSPDVVFLTVVLFAVRFAQGSVSKNSRWSPASPVEPLTQNAVPGLFCGLPMEGILA